MVNSDEYENQFNYTADITNMQREINNRLEQLCTDEKIEEVVRQIWSLNPKTAKHKKITAQ